VDEGVPLVKPEERRIPPPSWVCSSTWEFICCVNSAGWVYSWEWEWEWELDCDLLLLLLS